MKWSFFKSSDNSEEEYVNEVLQHNISEKNNNYKKSTEVILYRTDANDNVQMIKVCDWHGDFIPAYESIIWGPDIETHTRLIPYIVKRIDHMEDEENHVPTHHRDLIVVQKTETIIYW